MEFERGRHKHSHMDITPLVDIVFQLLLFFMLTSHFVKESAIRVKLPEAKSAAAESGMVNTLLITKENDIYFMDKRVDRNNLQITIKSYIKGRENDFLKIKADRDVKVGILVSVIDEVRLSGVKNFSIITNRQEKK